jgi:hypothetical protein
MFGERHYILVGKQPVICRDFMEWARWFEYAERHVALTGTRHFVVSSVFLGLDHNFRGEGDAILFETMVFARQHGTPYQKIDFATGDEQYCMRHHTWDDAHRWHWSVVRALRRKEGRSARLADHYRAKTGTIRLAAANGD